MQPFLESFQFCPQCGSGTITRASKRIDCGACGHHFYVNPTVAVAVIVELADGRFLWIRRARDPGKGMLAMAGGFVDGGEEAETAARREVEEEIGLRLEKLVYVTSATNLYRYAGFEYEVLDLFYHAITAPDVAWQPDPGEVIAVELLEEAAVDPATIAFPSMQKAWERFRQGRDAG